MIHSNIPKRPTLLAATGLAVALPLGFALNSTPAFAKGPPPCKNCDPDGGAITYKAALTGPVFHFDEEDVTPNDKGNVLLQTY